MNQEFGNNSGSPFKATGNTVVHRFVAAGLYTPSGATALLLGTFPSVLIREAFGRVRQTDVDFFYGSADNNFWKDLSIIYNTPLSYERTEAAIQQRKALLNNLKLAMSDVIYSCASLGSAMDTALENIVLNQSIITTLDTTPTINKLYFTSSSGKVNAETLALRILRDAGRSSNMQIVQKSGPRRRQFLYTDAGGKKRILHTVTLISPSPLAEQMAGIKPEQRREQYKMWLPAVS